LDPSQSEIATEEHEDAKSRALKSVCSYCERPVVDGPSGTISMWIFDGIYCSCTPEQRNAQVLYFGPHRDSSEAEAKALASLIASSNAAATATKRLNDEDSSSSIIFTKDFRTLETITRSEESEASDFIEAESSHEPELSESSKFKVSEIGASEHLAAERETPETKARELESRKSKGSKLKSQEPQLLVIDASPDSDAPRLVVSEAPSPSTFDGPPLNSGIDCSENISLTPPPTSSAPRLVLPDGKPIPTWAPWNWDSQPTPEVQFRPENKTGSITREILPAGQIAQTAPESLVGKLIGDNYLVIEFIGKGFNGNVFKVNREGIPGIFVLKILQPNDRFTTRQNTRFLAQAKLVKELDHHSVLSVYDAGVTDDQCPFIITDYFGSERLSDTLDEDGPLDEKTALDVFIQIAEALIHAHYMGVTHRDVKPSNVRVKEEDDGSKTVKLADCGVGKMYPDPNRETRYFTENGMEYGDARYMSPEQYSGATADHRADIYSFGCLMYEVLTGRPPFIADKVSMLIYKHVKKRPRSIDERFPELQISQDLDRLIMRCLQKLPDNRYQSVSDLRDDLITIKAGKRVRRVFKTHLNLTPVTRKTAAGRANAPPELVAVIMASWLAFWVGYSASARVAIRIVLTSAIMAMTLLGAVKWASHELEIADSASRVNRNLEKTLPRHYGELNNYQPVFVKEQTTPSIRPSSPAIDIYGDPTITNTRPYTRFERPATAQTSPIYRYDKPLEKISNPQPQKRFERPSE
jgi:serine/threonine protein kinase